MTNRQRLVVQTLLLILLGVHPAFPQGMSTWFLAEGANNATFTQEIEVGNPSSQALAVTVTLLPQADAVATTLTQTFVMPPTSRLTVRLGPDFGLNGAASARVSAVVQGTTTPADIVVERTMSFTGPNPGGSHNASGVPAGAAAMTWTLAEGANGAQTPGETPLGLDTFVMVANPNPTPTQVRATYLTSTGVTLTTSQTAPADSRVTFWPRAEHAALGNAEFSTIIESLTTGNVVVAERAMYFDNFRSGHDALGVTAASPTWYFAEGFTGGNATTAFETFVLLVNPGATPTTATVDYLLDSGAVISRTYPLAARERFTIWVDQEGRESDSRLIAGAFGMRVTAPVPIGGRPDDSDGAVARRARDGWHPDASRRLGVCRRPAGIVRRRRHPLRHVLPVGQPAGSTAGRPGDVRPCRWHRHRAHGLRGAPCPRRHLDCAVSRVGWTALCRVPDRHRQHRPRVSGHGRHRVRRRTSPLRGRGLRIGPCQRRHAMDRPDRHAGLYLHACIDHRGRHRAGRIADGGPDQRL
jgi:hypothetical protein